jgi:hypothetical protein
VDNYRDLAFGTGYLAYRCGEDRSVWYVLEIENPSKSQSIQVEVAGEHFWLEANWVENDLLLADAFGTRFCRIENPSWGVDCEELPFWGKNVSPDGRFLEVREGRFTSRPEQVGYIPVDCLLGDRKCTPSLRPGWISSDGDQVLHDAAWLEDSSGLLYIVGINTVYTNNETDETEFWLLDLDSMELEKIGRYPRKYSYSKFTEIHYRPGWSPKGDQIVLYGGGNYFLLSISSGEITPLTEGGVILGEIDLN